MRYYSKQVRARVETGPDTLGLQLARRALQHELSVVELSFLLGTARATIYNWFAGKPVAIAYRPSVQKLIHILVRARSRRAAWSAACSHFNRTNF